MSSLRERIAKAIGGRKDLPDVHELVRRHQGSNTEATVFSAMESRALETVSIDKLEKLYLIDGITFRDVNDYVDRIIGTAIHFTGDPRLVKECEEWSERVNLKRLLEEGIKDIFITGNAYYELGYTPGGDDIVKVRLINPRLIDYIRNHSGEIERDEYSDPVGFVMKVHGDTIEWRKDEIVVNGEVRWRSDGTYDGRDRIVHLRLFTLGDNEVGISPLQTVYKSAIIRMNLEENTGETSYRSGALVVTVGKENEPPPRPESIQKIVDDVSKIRGDDILGLPSGVKLDQPPVPEMSDRSSLLLYFAGVQSLAMGIPLTRHLLPGTRVALRSADSLPTDLDYEHRILCLQSRLADQIRRTFIFRYLSARGLINSLSEVPSISFTSSTPFLLREIINLLARLGRRGLIRRDPELEEYIRRELGLPTTFLEREVDMWNDDSSKIPGMEDEKGTEVDKG